MRTQNLQKRIEVLEAQRVPTSVSGYDWRRRLAKCNASLEGRPWTCLGTPEQKARRDAKLARYSEYFDTLYAEHGQGEGNEEY